MTAVLLATCADLPSGDEDAALLDAALRRRGIDPRWAVWDDPTVDWGAGLTVLRSTWDYTGRREQFLAWTRALPRLVNPAEVVAWNSDKTYLRDLAGAGVPIVPTEWIEPGRPVPLPVSGEFVLKPSVGAGSRGAGRFTPDRATAATAHAAALHDAGRVVLLQPYLADVDLVGETALVYVDGRYSHAVTKGAMLPESAANPLDLTAGELFVEERILPADASPAERGLGEQVVGYVRERFGDQLYCRVDLLPTADGPVVIELELTEPSLFLGRADGAADRLAGAIAARA